MAVDSITNFITPIKDYMNWVQSTLTALTSGGTALFDDVTVFEGQNEQLLFNWINQSTINQCVIQYEGSEYNSSQNGPRRIPQFSVWVVYRYTTDREVAQDYTFDLLEDVIAGLDHEIYNSHVITYVVSDEFVEFPNAALCVYRITFVAEDY